VKTTLEQADAYMASCVRCGECCRRTIIEIDVTDLVREPKLRPLCNEYENEPGSFILGNPCPLQSIEGLCTIYPTRPHVCLSAAPGGNHCCPVKMLPDETEHKIFTEE